MVFRGNKQKFKKAQLELNLGRNYEPDRNFHKGGRSFYFFDFDDNVAVLTTPIVIFHNDTGDELLLSSSEFAQNHGLIGKQTPYQNYHVNFDDRTGSFRYFRDEAIGPFERLQGKSQSFVRDLQAALNEVDHHWKAPSWDFFYHATFNQRPVSIITARGHHPKTIKTGIAEFIRYGHLPWNPNYLAVFPVSNPEIRKGLGDHALALSIPELKKLAIRKSVELALEKYGKNPFHRFGMSDDDLKNVELIREEMTELKRDYPKMSFFVIHTHKSYCVKEEIKATRSKRIVKPMAIDHSYQQLPLFH